MLTLKRQRFASNYALTGNGVQSAVTAGYAAAGAHVEASRLLKKPEVVAAVASERERLREQSDLKAEDVIRGLREIAEDQGALHGARVSAWNALGDYLGLFQWNPVAEGVTAFLSYLAGNEEPAIDTDARVLDMSTSSFLSW